MTSLFEKINSQRKTTSQDLDDRIEYINRLEAQLGRMKEPLKLQGEIDHANSVINSLYEDLQQRQVTIDLQTEKIENQKREIDILNQALDSCVFYQGRASLPAGGLSGEKMRAIYNELGKRQVNIHALSISLAKTKEEASASRNSAEQFQRELESMIEVNEKLAQDNTDIRNNQVTMYTD